ncbi:Rieske domain-containing protein isoform X1 [Micropterus dolomieu]|uniref:Rieske domain-containing protein isoform X1 n=1 Tax=Micropterus dolomieu TaxID=147949 RepID=UPI001E8EAABF|nr:Rieske domain-containing protein isoform X1 [Micropterus dolomieu]
MASGSGDEEGSADGVSWRLIGPVSGLSNKRCRLMYSSHGYESDVCLFYVKGEFFAMDARCSHSGKASVPKCIIAISKGGPLCEGDIEEADGVLQVFCPWHDYDFNLRTGKSGSSLQQQVYEVKLEDGNVYVKHASRLSLQPFPADQKS